MSNEINYKYTVTGDSLYFTLENSAGLIWNGTAFVALAVADWATYDLAMTETPASGYRYLGSMPAVAAGKYRITVFRRVGATPAVTDEMLTAGELGWTGSAECSLLNYLADTKVNYRDIDTGLTLYATFELITGGTIWNGSAMETMAVANWATYDVALTETPASSYRYMVTIPALSTGRYKVTVYKQAGASPAITDDILAVGESVVFSTGTPIRQQIMTALQARMETITTANGYRTNVGSNVFLWKAGPFLSGEVPGMDIRDSDTFKDETVGEQEHTLDINIRAISSGDTSPETIRQIQADIIQAIGTDLTFGGLADDTGTITAEQIDVETADAVKTGCGVRFSITYLTERFGV